MEIISLNVDKKIENIEKLALKLKQEDTIWCLQDMPNITEETIKQIIQQKTTKQIKICHSYNGPKERKYYCSTIIISNTLQLLQTNNNQNNEAIFVGAMIGSKKRKYHIINCYIRPRTNYKVQEDALRALRKLLKNNHTVNSDWALLVGDVNGSSLEWCPITAYLKEPYTSYNSIKRSRGARLEFLLRQMKLYNTLNKNNVATFSSNQTESYIDIAYAGKKLMNKIKRAQIIDNNSLGHKAISILIRERVCKQSSKLISRRKYESIREGQFKQLLESIDQNHLKNWYKLDNAQIWTIMNKLTYKIYDNLIAAQTEITKTIKKRLPEIKMSESRLQINLLAKLKTKGKRIKNKTQMIKFEKQRRKILKVINNQVKETNSDLWKRIKTNTNKETNEHCNSNALNKQEEIDQIAIEKFPYIPRGNHSAKLNNIKLNISDQELEEGYKTLKKKHHTGPEGLHSQTMYHSLKYIQNIIASIIRMSFWIGRIPEACQCTKGILIPKKEDKRYRIVHVGTPLMTIIEAIAIKRLNYILEKNKLLDVQQYGFTPNRSRKDLIAKLVDSAYKNKLKDEEKALTTIVNIDIAGAFDNVNQEMLINKLFDQLKTDEENCDIRKWLIGYILERNITINYKHLRSQKRDVCKGVPQGSALGPALWNFFINNISSNLSEVEVLKYADDLMLIYHGNDQDQLQSQVDKLCCAINNINLDIEAKKCSSMTIKLLSKFPNQPRQLRVSINKQEVPTVNETKHLGVSINRSLLLGEDKTSLEKVQANMVKLFKINNLGLIKNAKEWRILIESLIASTIISNNSVILPFDKKASTKANLEMAKAIKTIFSWPQNTSNKLALLLAFPKHAKISAIKECKLSLISEHKESYKSILEMANIVNGSAASKGQELAETNFNAERAHYNPNWMLRLKEAKTENLTEGNWMHIVGFNKRGVEIICGTENILTRQSIFKHSESQNEFINILATINELSKEMRKIKWIAADGSAIAALKNYKNLDERIITTREQIAKAEWSLIVASPESIKEKIINNKHLIKAYERIEEKRLDWPDIKDYIMRGRIKKEINLNESEYKKHELLTKTCRKICKDVKPWTEVNIGEMRTSTALALTGVSSQNGLLGKEKEINYKWISEKVKKKGKITKKILKEIADVAFEN